MKIKVFKIRLADEHLAQDQNEVNNFLAGVDMKKSSSTLITSAKDHFWSIIIHYEEKSRKADGIHEKEFSPITPHSPTHPKPKKRETLATDQNETLSANHST